MSLRRLSYLFFIAGLVSYQPVFADVLEDLRNSACGPRAVAVAGELLGISFSDAELVTVAAPDGTSSLLELRDFFCAKGAGTSLAYMTPRSLTHARGVFILPVTDLPPTISRRLRGPHFVVVACRGNEAPQVLDATQAIDDQRLLRFEDVVQAWTGLALQFTRSQPVVSQQLSRFVTTKDVFLISAAALVGVICGAYRRR